MAMPETNKPIHLPKGLDILSGILNPPQPFKPVVPKDAAGTKQQSSPRDKQFRGGNKK